jgi:hypothetical protein
MAESSKIPKTRGPASFHEKKEKEKKQRKPVKKRRGWY